MEHKDTLDSSLDQLYALDSSSAEYMLLFTDELRNFEIEIFILNPSHVSFSYPDLISDQNEIMALLDDAMSADGGKNAKEIKRIMKAIYDATSNQKVTRWALTPIMKHLGLAVEESASNETSQSQEVEPIRFHMQNLLWSRSEIEKFYRACGLTQITDQGSGSHTIWRGSDGKSYGTSSDSKKMWAKNNIKELLEKDYPVEKIQAACKKLRISFRIISNK